ncbi:MAG: hypothetical protein [Bacteriophage sp.]|nr:MAG: hypothetical protein [Bacteriophage sp.]
MNYKFDCDILNDKIILIHNLLLKECKNKNPYIVSINTEENTLDVIWKTFNGVVIDFNYYLKDDFIKVLILKYQDLSSPNAIVLLNIESMDIEDIPESQIGFFLNF